MAGKGHIHDHDIGLILLGGFDGLHSISRFTHNHQRVDGLQYRPQAGPAMTFDDQDATHALSLHPGVATPLRVGAVTSTPAAPGVPGLARLQRPRPNRLAQPSDRVWLNGLSGGSRAMRGLHARAPAGRSGPGRVPPRTRMAPRTPRTAWPSPYSAAVDDHETELLDAGSGVGRACTWSATPAA